jgi:hypothetical protein
MGSKPAHQNNIIPLFCFQQPASEMDFQNSGNKEKTSLLKSGTHSFNRIKPRSCPGREYT